LLSDNCNLSVCSLAGLQDVAAGGSGSSSIHELASQGNIAALQACLDSGAAVDSRDSDGCTALHFAADRGLCDVAMLLLAAGADINAQVCVLVVCFSDFTKQASVIPAVVC
jgi:ankyrin repeat protein